MASQKKTVLITGCSPGGIGHALAKEFYSSGHRVFATGRTVEKIKDLKELGIACVSLVVDDPASVAACHTEVERLLEGRGLDYLINNAGKSTSQPAVEIDLDEAKDMFATNVFGVMNINQAFLPQLLLAKGTIVNIGSVAGHLPLPFYSVYCASKAALYAYSDCLRVELAPLGVKVTHVQTGSVKTNLTRDQTHLREDSIFSPISKEFIEQQEAAAAAGMDPAKFAKPFVKQILAGHSGVLWMGENAAMIRILSALEYYLPFRIFPSIFSKAFGLNKLKAQ